MSKHWLCQELFDLRKKAKLSREALGAPARTSASTIANFESGKTNVGFCYVERLFHELGYEIDIHEIKKGESVD